MEKSVHSARRLVRQEARPILSIGLHYIGRMVWVNTGWITKLATDIRSSSVISDLRFRCSATNGNTHLYENAKIFSQTGGINPDASRHQITRNMGMNTKENHKS